MTKAHAMSLALTTAVASGCGSGRVDGPGNDTTGATTSSTTCAPGDSCNWSGTTSEPYHDESTSCADAVELDEVQDDLGRSHLEGAGTLGKPGDRDYFKLTAKAGSWLSLATEANPEGYPGLINTVITLYDESGTEQLAQNDDAYPPVDPDSALFYHVAAAGSYCLEVQEHSDWVDGPLEGGYGWDYQVIATPIALDESGKPIYEGYDQDLEGGNDDIAGAQALTNVHVALPGGMISDRIYGMFDTVADVDVFSFVAPQTTTAELALWTHFRPSGSKTDGSTIDLGLVELRVADGTIIAALDFAYGAAGFAEVPLTTGTSYYLVVNRPVGETTGPNDFWIIDLESRDSINLQEQDDEANATSAGAEPTYEQIDPYFPSVASRYFGGHIPAGDTDWWSFTANAGDQVEVACASRRVGSGVGDLTVALFADPPGSPLQSETESATKDLLWSDSEPGASLPAVTATSTGEHYVELRASKMIPEGATSTHYLCGVRTVGP
jgi:hypothetical protein